VVFRCQQSIFFRLTATSALNVTAIDVRMAVESTDLTLGEVHATHSNRLTSGIEDQDTLLIAWLLSFHGSRGSGRQNARE